VRIAILAPPGVQSLDVVGPAEVFREAFRRRQKPGAYVSAHHWNVAISACGDPGFQRTDVCTLIRNSPRQD
jgi:putative intracellular protease/amidase